MKEKRTVKGANSVLPFACANTTSDWEIRGGRGCQLEFGLWRGRVNTGETDNATVVAYSSALCCALSGGDD
nr:hypothetical protein Itr_chr04CG11170 [Ipomoea trifida]